jgi:long-chain acyl-CoA synthetase
MASPAPLDIQRTLAGRRILLIGATGFVGKVALSLLLDRYPVLDKLFVLTRAGAGSSSEERFFDKVAGSPVFDPIRARFAGEAAFIEFLRERCVPLPGDVSRPDLNFSADDLARIGHLDLIVNCAGLVTFNPTLESAIRINVLGVQHALDLARKTNARLVHVSTCFVAGERDGEIWEDEPLVGAFPRRDSLPGAGFAVASELADCQRIIEQQKSLADDRAHISLFRERAAKRLREEGRDEDEPATLKIAVQRERKLWLAERLTELGMERARHWGWTNTYTYTKALGEQLCGEAARADGDARVRTCVVRPAIVESALRYPFPGWNEGFTTTAPLAFLNIQGHRTFPAGDGVRLDVIPVDLVAAGLVMAMAATIADENELVYQLGSSDTNPLYLTRAVELLGLHKRRWFRARTSGNASWNALQARLEPIAVSRRRYEATSAPIWKAAADGLSAAIERATPRWGAPRLQGIAAHARNALSAVSRSTAQTDELFQLFMPFIHDRHYVFRCDHTRALHARLTPRDREALLWDPEHIDWRSYWLDVHMVGLEKWVFPSLEGEFAPKPRSVYTYKDLLEMFDAATKHWKSRTAMRRYPSEDESDTPRYTYSDLGRLATRMAGALVARGVVAKDTIVLVCENRPEWGIAYFAILKAGGVVVPAPATSTSEDVARIASWAQARLVVASDALAAQLGTLPVEVARLEALLDERVPQAPLAHRPRADEPASLLFTSGTTGAMKGVTLTHRNFTTLLGRLASVFDLDAHDGLVSVLPLHHAFELTTGLFMPLMRGAQIAYLDRIDGASLQRALSRGQITGIVGVPVLYEELERQLRRPIAARGAFVERVFDALVDAGYRFRDRLPPTLAEAVLNLPRLVFWPLHARLGGRLRLLVSGGSSLDPRVARTLRGLGFNLYEGYGLTEAAPALAVSRQRTRWRPGSVGEALPGVTLKIAEPDQAGTGEILAQGPNVMAGYHDDAPASEASLQDGWLRTGDLGRIEDGRLHVLGRKSDLITTSGGARMHPDELETHYGGALDVRELAIVGLADDDARGHSAAALIVLHPHTQDHEAARARVRAHLAAEGAKVAAHERLRVVHFTDAPLPRGATRQVRRGEVARLLAELEARAPSPPLRLVHRAEADAPSIPAPLVALGRRGLDLGQRLLYERLFETRIEGAANVPVGRPFLVAANHASHLDMGLVKRAIGDWGPRLRALAAKDYFFADPLRRAYFENFTDLVPMDRHGSLRQSLRLAEIEIRAGNILLVFPEGTRSRNGTMIDFKPAIGYLALHNRVDVLPIYLEGTFDAMPSGSIVPRSRELRARVGPVLSYESLRLATAGAARAESYRLVAAITERAVRALAPEGSLDRAASPSVS